MKLFKSRLVAAFTLALGLGFLTALDAAEPSQSGEMFARFHLAGFKQSNDESSGRVFREIWALPASAQLRNETLDKLASKLASCFVPNGEGNGNCARLIRPLLNDLFDSEVCGEVVEHRGGAIESVLALRLDEARRGVWETNCSKILAGWKLRPDLRTERVVTIATNSWFGLRALSGADSDGSIAPSTGSIFGKLNQGARPVAAAGDYLLRLEADLSRWMQRVTSPTRAGWPRIDLTVSGRKENLRSQARLQFQEPLDARIEKWNLPLQTIRDPLISFTAVQGLGSWLRRQPWFQELGLEQSPNQLYLWELSQTAFQVQAAVPVANAARALDRIAAQGVPKLNRVLGEYAVGNVSRSTNQSVLAWRGLPLLVPYLGTAESSGKEFLHAGLFPVDPPTNAPPQQLFDQLTSQTNLLYYDWEITQARLTHLRPMLQVGAMFLTISPMSTNSAAAKWLDAVEPRLGNTVTEVSMVSPRELRFLRNSHIGLNGLELLALANWLEGTNFPKMDFKIKFQPVVRSTRPPRAR